MSILDTISKINTLFNDKYSNAGFLEYSNHNAISFFTTQSCWYYAYMLKKLFPKGDIYLGNSHAIFKYEKDFYDVGGYYYFYNEKEFIADKEIVGNAAFDHPEHREVMNLCNNIISEIKNNVKKRVI